MIEFGRWKVSQLISEKKTPVRTSINNDNAFWKSPRYLWQIPLKSKQRLRSS